MSIQRRLLPVVTITGSTLMVGCGGSGGSSGSCGSAGSACPPPIVIGPGYYQGTLTAQGGTSSSPVVAIIADNGDGVMSADDGSYYRFNVGFSGDTITGTYIGLAPGTGGTQKTSGSISGQGTSTALTGTLSVAGASVDSFQLDLQSVYKQHSALSMLMGTWSYTANGFSLTLTIASDGTLTGTDSNECSYQGTLGIINPLFDAYTATYLRSCSNSSLTFTGLAVYLPASGTVNAQIEMLTDDNATEFLAADLQ